MYYTQDQIDQANQADLISFLQGQGEQLTRAGQEYRWKRHDSLTIRGNKWYRHSQSKGGGPVDFVMEFFGRSFTEAVELLTGEKGEGKQPQTAPPTLSDFQLPPRSPAAGQTKPRAPIRLPTATPQHRQPHSEELPHSSPPH